MYKTILVPLDGSPRAETILPHVISLAAHYNARVVLLQVVEPIVAMVTPYDMGLVTPDGGLEHYDGLLRVVDSDGTVLEAGFPPARYREILGEAVEPWSYLKFPYYKPAAIREAQGGRSTLHYQAGMYRVGPLARLNICDFAGTPRADAELREFRRLAPRGRPVATSFHYHYARLIEILYALERIAETLDDPSITDKHIRAHAEVNNLVGVGVSEAPRGTLFHGDQQSPPAVGA